MTFSDPNEGREGYKETKIGWIPDDWNMVELKDILRKVNRQIAVDSNRKYPLVGVRWYGNGCHLHSTVLGNDLQTTTLNQVEAGDLIYNKMWISKTAFGIVLNEYDGYFATSEYPTFIPKLKSIDSTFLSYLFLTKKFQYQANSHTNGTTERARLNPSDFLSLKIALPTKIEQREIRNILSTWDHAIDRTRKLIEAKEQLKRGLMQKLLTGEVRFPDDTDKWEEVKVGSIGTFFKGKGITKSQIIDSGHPCVTYGDLYTRYDGTIDSYHSFISESTSKQSVVTKQGDILFAGSGETAEDIGKCAVQLQDVRAYAGGDIIVFRPNKHNSIYLSFSIDSDDCRKQRWRFGQGYSVVHIYSREIGKIRIKLPRTEIQERIAALFIDLQREIKHIENGKKLLLTQKKALVQRLLTGQIRVSGVSS